MKKSVIATATRAVGVAAAIERDLDHLRNWRNAADKELVGAELGTAETYRGREFEGMSVIINWNIGVVMFFARQQLKEEARKVLKGIDQESSESEDGYWDTSVGVKYGKGRLAALGAMIDAVTAWPPKKG